MRDWNVVISLHEQQLHQALHRLRQFGSVSRTDFFNVLVMRVDDIEHFLETLRQRLADDPPFAALIARVVPLTQTFNYLTIEAFETQAREAILRWVPDVAGKRFHIRMHRRGFKGRLDSHNEEKALAEVLLEALEASGRPGRIAFEDPDAIIAVETVGQRGGMSLWTREDMQDYPFLGLD
jgi:tRNA(Ser,Leu) C12 N-acetylase TAN1